MFKLDSISDDEIDYFDNFDENSEENAFIDYLSNFEYKLDCEKIEIPDLTYKLKITANIATQPSRFESLLSTLQSIDGQFDEIRIYLNNYKSVPPELEKYTTYIGTDLTDNGKFFWSSNKNEYYFTIDDDIIYPSDYVEQTIPQIKNRVVSYHGRRLLEPDINYYDNHKTYYYYSYLEKERKIDVAGTGVMAFNTNIFSPDLWKSPNYKMTDLLISLEAHLYNIPIVCLPKNNRWLFHEDVFLDGIYFEFRGKEEKQIKYANTIYSLVGKKIDINKVSYQFTDESIENLISFLSDKNDKSINFINIRTGNGQLIESISKLLNFKFFKSIDTDKKRIDKCKKNYETTKVNYEYIRQYEHLYFVDPAFFLIDDYILSKTLTTDIYDVIPEGSHVMCHNIIDGVFPDFKIEMTTTSGQLIPFYYYKK